MSVFQLLFTTSVLGLITIGLTIWVYVMLPKSSTKVGIIGFALFYLIWMCLLYSTKYPGLELDTFGMISRCIFISGVLMISFFCHFSISLSSPDELKHIRYWMFQGNMLLLLFCIILGLVEKGVEHTEKGVLPVFGPLYAYNALSLVAIGVYSLFLLAKSYRKTQSEILHYQLESVLYSGIATFVGLMISVNILPILFDKPELVLSGGVWPLFLFTGISYVLVHGKTLYVKRAFTKLLKQPGMKNDDNYANMRELIRWVDMVVHDNPEKSHKKIRFKNFNQEVEFDACKGLIQDDNEKNQLEVKNSILEGIVANSDLVHRENHRLSMAMLKAENLLNQKILEPSEEKQLQLMKVSDREKIVIRKYEDLILEHIKNNFETYNQKFICFSNGFYQALLKLEKQMKISSCVILQGENGVGKSMLAKAVHYKEFNDDLYPIHCANLGFQELNDKIETFKREANGETQGILLRQLDELNDEALMALDALLNQSKFKVYITTTLSLEKVLENQAERISHQIKNIQSIHVPSLKDRHEDVFYLSIWMVRKFAASLDHQIHTISTDAMNTLYNKNWLSNVSELESIIRSTVMSLENDEIETFNVVREVPEEKVEFELIEQEENDEFSQLEVAEKNVIFNCLKRNNYNKTRTKNDLKITINTLNSKMKKYKISIPEAI